MNIQEITEKVLVGENSLYNFLLRKIELAYEKPGLLKISISFQSFTKKAEYSKITLVFTGIKAYAFTYSDKYSFDTISEYKFFQLEDGMVYLCLDPDESTKNFSEEDLDFVIANELELLIEE